MSLPLGEKNCCYDKGRIFIPGHPALWARLTCLVLDDEARQALNQPDNFYDYEKLFVSIWKDLGREVLEKNIGDLPADKRKKKMLISPEARPHHHQ